MCPAIVSGIITGDAPVSQWPFFLPTLKNKPKNHLLTSPTLFPFLCKLCLLPLYFQSIFGIFCYFCQRKPTLYKPHGFFGLSCHILTKLCNLLPCHNKVAILTKNKQLNNFFLSPAKSQKCLRKLTRPSFLVSSAANKLATEQVNWFPFRF